MKPTSKDSAYIGRGIVEVPTESSVMVSSSKYLNSLRLRDWVSTHLLRRNGPDRPIPSDNVDLVRALHGIRDDASVDALFEAERKINPPLEAWLSERFMSTYELEDLKGLPPGSVGGILYKFVTDNNASLDIIPRAEPKGHFDFYTRRHLQTHDLEHIVCGGLFDSMGESVIYWMTLSNLFEHLSPELAGELNVKYMFNALRVLTRSLLHYPETWPKMLETISQGIAVGQASGPVWMFKYEHVLDKTPEEAREILGIRKAYDVDTTEMNAIFTEQVKSIALAL